MSIQFALISLVCCVMHAAVLLDDNTPLISERHGKVVDFSEVKWREKIKNCLGQEGQVRVFYLPKEDERYSVTYDVTSSKMGLTLTHGFGESDVIVPTEYALKEEFLKGCIVRVGDPVPSIKNTDFPQKDVPLERYDKPHFFSSVTDDFLEICCARLADQGKGCGDHDVKIFTADMLKQILPKWKYKRLSWNVVDEDQSVEVLQKQQNAPVVLLVVGGVGILRGKLKNSFLQLWGGPSWRSLFYYKQGRLLDEIRTKYPYSKEEWRSCLNYPVS